MNRKQGPRLGDRAAKEARDPREEAPGADDAGMPQRSRRHQTDLQDWTRLVLAIALVLPITLLGVTVPVALLWLHEPPPEQVEDTVIAVLGPLAGLAGAALGFYFGGRGRRRAG